MLLALVLVLAACSGSGDEAPGARAATPSAAAPANDGANDGADAGVDEGSGPVQDVWIYERVQTVDQAGELIDITDDLVTGLSADESAAVELTDGVTFTPVPGLDPRMRDDASGFREDLEVVAGIVESGDGRRLQVVATPTAEKSVEADDLLVLDLAHLGLPDGAPLIVDFAFAQGIPGDDEAAGTGGPELLRARLADERVHWFAVDDEEGTGVGLIRVFGSVPADGTGTNTRAGAATDGSTPTRTDGFVARPAVSARGVSSARPGAGGGGIPAKALPVISPLNKLGSCRGNALKCLSKYFKSQEKGTRKVMDDLFDTNTPGPPSRPCVGCGGIGGDPHLRTFDGLPYDLQLAGEFVLARTDDVEVQVRLAPLGSTAASVVSAVAVGVGEHRVTLRDDREPVILVDGQPLTREAAEAGVQLGDATARLIASDLVVTASSGVDVRLRHALSGTSDVLVSPGSAALEWTGLLGDADGDVTDDLVTRDGTTLATSAEVAVAEQPGVEALYDTFGMSWRISDDESLFDYEDGETTATFTDFSFPSQAMGLDDLPAGDRAVAEALCTEAGISDPFWHDACVLDYALTKDASFVTRSRALIATLDPPLAGWAHQVSGDRVGPMVLDRSSGHLLAPAGMEEKGELTALDVESGEVAWSAETAGTGCVAVVADGQVVVPVPGEDGMLDLSVRDPETGEEQESAPTALRTCEAMAVHENTVVVQSGNTLLGIDVVRPEVAFELELDKLVSPPVVSGDGQVWVLRNNRDQMEAVRIDPAEGTPVTVPVPIASLFGNIAATADGIVLGFRGEHRGTGGLLRLDPGGAVWQTAMPQVLDGVEHTRLPSGPISVAGDRAAAYLGSTMAFFDLADGSLSETAEASRVHNNGGALLLTDGGTVVVGPFGGDAWVEAWQPGATEPLWVAQVPGEDIHDAKAFGPVTATGQVIVAATSKDGYVVAKVGPGS